MEPQELRLMLKDLESDLIERKASLSDPDRIRQAICAFANDHPFDLIPPPRSKISISIYLSESTFAWQLPRKSLRKTRALWRTS